MEHAIVLNGDELASITDICADWLAADFEPKRPEQVALAHRIIDTMLVTSGFTPDGKPFDA